MEFYKWLIYNCSLTVKAKMCIISIKLALLTAWGTQYSFVIPNSNWSSLRFIKLVEMFCTFIPVTETDFSSRSIQCFKQSGFCTKGSLCYVLGKEEIPKFRLSKVTVPHIFLHLIVSFPPPLPSRPSFSFHITLPYLFFTLFSSIFIEYFFSFAVCSIF